ncbi:hypothetical protein [Dactylosporangium sp. CA-092794]|uniref:hypothetical protein n=1 Tax=Dactylosporangium sp. CA-092794 TaxID=3239929 RepID=UPI003D8A84DB
MLLARAARGGAIPVRATRIGATPIGAIPVGAAGIGAPGIGAARLLAAAALDHLERGAERVFAPARLD